MPLVDRNVYPNAWTSHSELLSSVEMNLEIPGKAIQEFCERWHVTALELFGSSVGGDFSEKSDVDVMVTFADGETPGLGFLDMKDELEKIFGRSVDLVTRKAIEKSDNPYRKQAILGTARLIYDKKAA
jgi:uncharacterized protein